MNVVMELLEDGELWERAQAGDAGAFGVLFDRHANSVYRYCFRRSADWALAEDLTSIVFFEAWRRRRDVLLSGARLLPWASRGRDERHPESAPLAAALPDRTRAPASA